MEEKLWVEDENHRTIGGVRWVALEVTGDCNGGGFPTCDALSCYDVCRYLADRSGCRGHLRKDGKFVRWYRLGGPALAFFDKPKGEPKPVAAPARPISEICMDGIRSSLKTFFQDRDRQAVEDLRDSRAASLDARVQAAMDAMMAVPDSLATPAPASATEDDIEIIIDPTPEQVPAGGAWGCWWDIGPSMLGKIGLVPSAPDKAAWAHFAIIVRGYLNPRDFVDRVRQMLAEKEGK